MRWTKRYRTNRVNRDDDSGTVVDAILFKAIRLYLRLLRPAGKGGSPPAVRTAYVFALCLTVGVQLVQIVGLYHVANDFQRFIISTGTIFHRLTGSYMGYVMVTKADRLWTVLDVARIGFTEHGRRDPSAVYRCKATSVALLLVYLALSAATFVAWIATMPVLIDGQPVSAAGPNDTVTGDRTATKVLWIPMAESANGSTHVLVVVYALDALITIINSSTWALFDCNLITVCFALDAQFRTLVTGYRKIGRGVTTVALSPDVSDISIGSNAVNSACYDELILQIADNRKIIMKCNEFFDIVRSTVLIQVLNTSNAMITLSYLIALLYASGWSIVSVPIMKYIIGFVTFIIQLYIYCWLFHGIENATSDINFGLYSCNWMAMNLKFKKTLLLAMNINNSSYIQGMKVTSRSNINLELFTTVVSLSYSITSVLVNITK